MQYFPEYEKEYQAIQRHNTWVEKVAEIYEVLMEQYSKQAEEEAKKMATEILGYDDYI